MATQVQVELLLRINGFLYHLEYLDPHPEVASVAWRLSKPLGIYDESPETYDVHQGAHGPECTCPDWIYRRNGTGEPCKHILACQEVRLL